MCYDIYVWIIWISCLNLFLKQQKRQKTISIPARYRYGFGKIEHGEFEIEPPPSWGVFLCGQTNSGTGCPIEIFQKRKMFRIEFPEILAWFQTPQTVSRPSRPDFQPRKTNSGTKRPIEIFKKRKMIRIEFPEFLAWFQTPQTVSRPSRPCPDRDHDKGHDQHWSYMIENFS